MDIKILEGLESVLQGALQLFNQTLCTFGDMLFRPLRFARAFSHDSRDAGRYVAPFTFLGISGFLCTKVLSATSALIIYQEYLQGEDTLQKQAPVVEQVASLSTLSDFLCVAIPITICIHAISSIFRYAISSDRDVKVGQSLYYAAGIQYLLIGVCGWVRYPLDWTNSGSSLERVSGMLELLVTIGFPTVLIILIAAHSLKSSARRWGRWFFVILPPVALSTSFAMAALPHAGGLLSAIRASDVRRRAVLRITLIDRQFTELSPGYSEDPRPKSAQQWIKGDSITVPILLTNQSRSRLLIFTEQAWLTTEGEKSAAPTEWLGRIFDPNRQIDVLSLSAGESIVLRFEGQRHSEVGLTNEARGRLELLQILPNGALQKIETHDWKPREPDETGEH